MWGCRKVGEFNFVFLMKGRECKEWESWWTPPRATHRYFLILRLWMVEGREKLKIQEENLDSACERVRIAVVRCAYQMALTKSNSCCAYQLALTICFAWHVYDIWIEFIWVWNTLCPRRNRLFIGRNSLGKLKVAPPTEPVRRLLFCKQISVDHTWAKCCSEKTNRTGKASDLETLALFVLFCWLAAFQFFLPNFSFAKIYHPRLTIRYIDNLDNGTFDQTRDEGVNARALFGLRWSGIKWKDGCTNFLLRKRTQFKSNKIKF